MKTDTSQDNTSLVPRYTCPPGYDICLARFGEIDVMFNPDDMTEGYDTLLPDGWTKFYIMWGSYYGDKRASRLVSDAQILRQPGYFNLEKAYQQWPEDTRSAVAFVKNFLNLMS